VNAPTHSQCRECIARVCEVQLNHVFSCRAVSLHCAALIPIIDHEHVATVISVLAAGPTAHSTARTQHSKL
jgi:hypothetical protein